MQAEGAIKDGTVATVMALFADYARHLDRERDPDAWADLFGTDGILVVRGRELTGHDALQKFATDSVPGGARAGRAAPTGPRGRRPRRHLVVHLHHRRHQRSAGGLLRRPPGLAGRSPRLCPPGDQHHGPDGRLNRRLGGHDGDRGHAGGTVELGQADPGESRDLPWPGPPAQLGHQLVHLPQSGRPDRLAVGDQAAVGVDRQPPGQGRWPRGRSGRPARRPGTARTRPCG